MISPDQSTRRRHVNKRLTRCAHRVWCKFINGCRPFRQWLVIPLLAVPLSGHAYAESASEAAVKTAFLYNFFKFIQWPQASDTPNGHNLCTTENDMLGDSPDVLKDKTIGDQPIVVLRGKGVNDLKDCHLVFIGATENAASILKKLNGLPIVTVSDQPGFIDLGGTISLLQSDNRLNFEINLAVANKNGVHIGAQLLKLAKRVITEQ